MIKDVLTHDTVKGGGASRSNTELRLQTGGGIIQRRNNECGWVLAGELDGQKCKSERVQIKSPGPP